MMYGISTAPLWLTNYSRSLTWMSNLRSVIKTEDEKGYQFQVPKAAVYKVITQNIHRVILPNSDSNWILVVYHTNTHIHAHCPCTQAWLCYLYRYKCNLLNSSIMKESCIEENVTQSEKQNVTRSPQMDPAIHNKSQTKLEVQITSCYQTGNMTDSCLSHTS